MSLTLVGLSCDCTGEIKNCKREVNKNGRETDGPS